MAKQKTKSASKEVPGKKIKAKTSDAASGTPKKTKSAVTATAKKVAGKKAAASVATPKKTKTTAAKIKNPAKKSATGKTKTPSTGNRPAAKPSPEERYRMVETAAYFIAEQHGFQGRSDEHWSAAERAIAIKLGQ